MLNEKAQSIASILLLVHSETCQLYPHCILCVSLARKITTEHRQLGQYYTLTTVYDKQALLLRYNVSASICVCMNKDVQKVH